MIENWMWHFPTHKIWVKINTEWQIIETDISNTNKTDFIILEVSNAILSAIKNNNANILERMNFIYKNKIKSILEKINNEKNINNNSDLNEENVTEYTYLSSDLEENKIEITETNKNIMISFDNNWNITWIDYNFNEENIWTNNIIIELNNDEYRKVKDSMIELSELSIKYETQIINKLISKQINELIKNILNKISKIVPKKYFAWSLSASES